MTFSGGNVTILDACKVIPGPSSAPDEPYLLVGYGPDGSEVFRVYDVVSHQCIGYLGNPTEGILDNQVLSMGCDKAKGKSYTIQTHLEVSEDGRFIKLVTEVH